MTNIQVPASTPPQPIRVQSATLQRFPVGFAGGVLAGAVAACKEQRCRSPAAALSLHTCGAVGPGRFDHSWRIMDFEWRVSVNDRPKHHLEWQVSVNDRGKHDKILIN